MPHRVAIIGAGFSGTATAINLLRQDSTPALEVVLIEAHARMARGLAYREEDRESLLNVPAGNMGLLDGQAGHFLEYCRKREPGTASGAFMPRHLFGEYLEENLDAAQASSNAVLERVRGTALAVRRRAQGFEVELSDARVLVVDEVVLALGHAPPAVPRALAGLRGHERFVADPWDWSSLVRVDGAQCVAILGTGHTAIDTLLRIERRARTKVFLISRHGLIPNGHRMSAQIPATAGLPEYLGARPATVSSHMGAIREEARRRVEKGGDWRDVLNELRPHTPTIWQRWSQKERRRFLERVRAYWEIHRHRLAPAIHEQVQELIASGLVEVVSGRLGVCFADDKGVSLEVRGGGEGGRIVRAAFLVNCAGPDYDIAQRGSPLTAQLYADGLVGQDALGMGVCVDERYRMIDREGRVVAGLYYVGPMLRAQYFEATAVPELRHHCAALARGLHEALAQQARAKSA